MDKKLKIDIAYVNIHQDTLALKTEILKFSNKLLEKGYFLHQVDSVVYNNEIVKAYIRLKSKFDTIQIRINNDEIRANLTSKLNDGVLVIPTDSLSKNLEFITKILQKSGKPFSKVYLSDFVFNDSNVSASLQIEDEKVRKIDKTVFKGYENFPIKFLSQLIDSKKSYNQDYITEINERINQLDFVKTTKNPEVLFTNDSTYIYMYLEKTQNNTIDANINFTSTTENQLIFNGKVDLELINIFNKGNRYKLFWNSVSKSIQSFELSTEIPYIFKSKFSPFIKFSIFKQDSTFVNTNFNFELQYLLKNRISISALYENENSTNLITNSNITSFIKNYIGLGVQTFKKDNNPIFSNKYIAILKVLFGNRNNNKLTTNQIKINAVTSYLWEVNSRSFIFSKLDFGYLNTDTYLQNELFRIGGANSLRGFAEQSIYSKRYLVSNLEYRYLTSSTSYLYSITDLGWISTITNNNLFASGLGIGYLFTTDNSKINIAFAVNKTSNSSFDFKNSQLIIGWKNYF